ncbi:MAG: hypothetical protein M1816_003230 [Peltula sp. TS41687]|nr:MAG: hypothetical protein M1816_003230 [Peltula sp. TS41687]
MLDWLTGNGRNSQSVSSGRDVTELAEPPQTPAPVFAVRAFKTAWFGTPQDIPEKDVVTQQQVGQIIAGKKNPRSDNVVPKGATTTNRLPLGRADANASRPAVAEENGLTSPLKPPGIMLTPGVGPSRRKTVSFGASVLDNEPKRSFRARKVEVKGDALNTSSHLPDSNSQAVKTESGRTRLTETLYEVRDQVRDSHDGESSIQKSTKVHLESATEDQDITVDMDKPRSTSGRHWMSEYQNYHEEAQHAIKRLKKYRDIAKVYSREKESEITSLDTKLRDESQKVKMLEAEVSDLVAILRSICKGDDGSEAAQARMAEKLASQTRLLVKYRKEIEELKAALEKKDASAMLSEKVPATSQGTSPRTAKTIMQTMQELQKARRQVREIGELVEEMGGLKSKVKDAEQKAKKLEEENTSLTEELARTKGRLKEMERQQKMQDDSRWDVTNIEAEVPKPVYEPTAEEEKASRKRSGVRLSMSSGEDTAPSKPHAATRSLRGVNLPPERAAAAMARLEQRKAERKRLRMQERKEENSRA